MIKEEVLAKAVRAKQASFKLANLTSAAKDQALTAMAAGLVASQKEIIEANAKDLANGKAKGLSEALLDRLMLNEARINDMAEGLRQVVALPDPIGEVIAMWKRPNGLQIGQIRVPLGVIGMIYEARPNVTVDAAGLAIKTGNAMLLRGGSEAIHSNTVIAKVIAEAAEKHCIPVGSIQLIESTDREAVNIMLKLNEYIDVLIPRGGAGLIQTVVKNATVPVIETGVGNCHVYVDSETEFEKAIDIVVNSKCHRPGVCNAAENLLVHQAIAAEFLPLCLQALADRGVELRGCERTIALVPTVQLASEADYQQEFLDLIMVVKVVDSLESAIEHINNYGTKHSEVIVTTNYYHSRTFLQQVDAAAVYVNASTRFTDGFQFGFGAEIGISTQKIHARGPMGLKELTSIKYVIYGEGQIRS